jgi:hypothetical protein
MIDDDSSEAVGRAIGGHARAAALTKGERKEIAQRAAAARWGKDLPTSTHEGIITALNMPCAVLSTGQRVLTQSGMMLALGRARQAKGREYYKGDVNLPAFLTAQNLRPYIPSDLGVTSSQIEFLTKNGQRAFGYADELLPEVCDVFIKADRAGVLKPNQRHIADRALIII